MDRLHSSQSMYNLTPELNLTAKAGVQKNSQIVQTGIEPPLQLLRLWNTGCHRSGCVTWLCHRGNRLATGHPKVEGFSSGQLDSSLRPGRRFACPPKGLSGSVQSKITRTSPAGLTNPSPRLEQTGNPSSSWNLKPRVFPVVSPGTYSEFSLNLLSGIPPPLAPIGCKRCKNFLAPPTVKEAPCHRCHHHRVLQRAPFYDSV